MFSETGDMNVIWVHVQQHKMFCCFSLSIHGKDFSDFSIIDSAQGTEAALPKERNPLLVEGMSNLDKLQSK